MKIKIKYHSNSSKLESHGNWIDLSSSEDISFKKFENKLIPLGVSIGLPKYFQGNIVPRSGTFKKYKLIQANHYGVVDGPDKISLGYTGTNDIWMFNAIAFEDTKVSKGDRICQFEIRPTMNAPWWLKLKWLFINNIEFIEVEELNNVDRGGFGSTDNSKYIAVICKSIKDFRNFIKSEFNEYVGEREYKKGNLIYIAVVRKEDPCGFKFDDVIVTELGKENKNYIKIIDSLSLSLNSNETYDILCVG